VSHELVTVFVPDNGGDLETALADVLAPYDEELEVAPYTLPCWCVTKGYKSETSECVTCEGSGLRYSTDNPSARWDYYTIVSTWTDATPSDLAMAWGCNIGDLTSDILVPVKGWLSQYQPVDVFSTENISTGTSDEEWAEIFKAEYQRCQEDPDLTALLVDYHI
jgi:hypothetical protein